MIDQNHPRATSLKIRDKIVHGVKIGITSHHGLITQGRAEAFDYLLGEKTHEFAIDAIQTAAAILLLAKYPVLSVNGNSAALCAKEYMRLAKILNCVVEINLFHYSKKRSVAVQSYLRKFGKAVILSSQTLTSAKIAGIASKRQFANVKGIVKADVVFVPLEDGDRTEALVALGKKVITIDLNPMSRTAQKATVTIVDNIVRAMPLLIQEVQRLKKKSKEELEKIVKDYNNVKMLHASEKEIRKSGK